MYRPHCFCDILTDLGVSRLPNTHVLAFLVVLSLQSFLALGNPLEHAFCSEGTRARTLRSYETLRFHSGHSWLVPMR